MDIINLFNLIAKISLDDKDYNKGMNNATQSGEKLGKSSEGVGSKLLSMGNIIKGVAVGAVGVFVKNSIMAASEVEEMSSKFTAVFGTMEGEADSWAKSFSDSIGRNKNDIKGMIASQADLMMGFGMTGDEALGLSKNITALAFDLGSFNNVADDESVLKLQKSIMGLETSGALESLGVDLTETTMKTSEYTKATGKSWEQLDRTEKMNVRYAEAMKQSSRAVGDAERTAGGFANSVKALQSKIKEFSQTIGAFFIPMATKMVTSLKGIMDSVLGFVGKIPVAIESFKVGMKDGADIVDNIWFVFNEVFGINIPDSILMMVSSVIRYWRVLWEIMLDAFNTIAVPIFDALKEIFDSTGITANGVFAAISAYFNAAIEVMRFMWESVGKPVFEAIMSIVGVVKDIFIQYMPMIQDIFSNVINDIVSIWNNNLKPMFDAIVGFIEEKLVPRWKWAFENVIGPVFGALVRFIDQAWTNGLKPIFTGIIDFITGVFSGSWSGAWNGVVSIFSGIFGGLQAIARVPINAVINMVNKMIQGLNKLSIPDWVPIIGGGGINIPEIPMLYKGTDYFKGTNAFGNTALVGEQGPELVELPTGSKVNTNKETNQMMNKESVFVINIDGREFMRAVSPYQEEFDNFNSRSPRFA